MTDAGEADTSPTVTGCVDHFTADGLSGWVLHDDERLQDQPVRVALKWQDLTLRAGHANRERRDILEWKGVERVGFAFRVDRTLAELLPEGSVLRVETEGGQELPVLNDAVPIGTATDGGEELRRRFAEGWHVSHWGAMKLPFRADPSRRATYADALADTADLFAARYGKVLFPFFGTLLGWAREGRFLDHDDDVDAAYLSRGHDLEEVAAEFAMIADDLAATGLRVHVVATGQLTVRPSHDQPSVDVFAAWLRPDGIFACYPYVMGPLRRPPLFKKAWLEGREFIVPEDHERYLELCYGPSWRVPDPAYQMPSPPEVASTMDALRAMNR